MKAWFDGYCKPNPGGIATYGFVIRSDNGKLIEDEFGIVGEGEEYRSNVAEFEALYRLSERIKDMVDCKEYSESRVEIYGDCKPIIHSAHHNNYCSDASREKNDRLHEILDELDADVKWISSTENSEADSLSRRAFAVEKHVRT